MINPAPLSPAAQAVLDASIKHSGPAFEPLVRKLVSDALRAAVNQMAAWADEDGQIDPFDLLAIADELEAQ